MFRPLELFIGTRYIRAKRRNHFISFISIVSMLGLIIGITALITVISVMNGFAAELQSRILGAVSQATITGVAQSLEISLAKSSARVLIIAKASRAGAS